MGIIAAFAVPHPPLLIPSVGDESKPEVQKTEQAFREVAARSAALAPETLVVFSPHAPLYYDYFHVSPGAGARGSFMNFGSPARYEVAYDEEFVAGMEALFAEKGIPGGAQGERDATLDHATMVPLHFFGEAAHDRGGAGRGVKVVRMGLSGLSRAQHREVGRVVAQVAEALDRRTVIIASGDLSHKLLASGPYGYVPEGPEFDEQICAALAEGSVAEMLAIDEELSETAAECGLRSFIMMGGALEGLEYESELLSYEGPFGVGYAVASYLIKGGEGSMDNETAASTGTETSLPVQLARQTLQSYFERGGIRPTIETPEIQALLDQLRLEPEHKAVYERLAHTRAGAFVSLHAHGDLRGCIGTLVDTQGSVLAEIIQNAVSAAVEDPRFPPVSPGELDGLDIKVDVLGVSEPVTDLSTLDAERYGVIVSLGYRRGLLLPALDGVDTPSQQISIALSKAGIGAHEPFELERFEVVRYT